MNTQDTGDLSELRVAAKLKELGCSVMIPFTESQQYDLVADDGNELVRVQVKSGRKTPDGKTEFSCFCSNSSKSGNNRTFYTADDIDGIAVYVHETDDYYWVPIEEANKYKMTLSKDGKNPHREYSFESRFS